MSKQDTKSDHGHHHGSATHALLPSDPALRVKAIETILLDKGLVDPAALDALIDTFQNKVGPKNGAAAVAKATGAIPLDLAGCYGQFNILRHSRTGVVH